MRQRTDKFPSTGEPDSSGLTTKDKAELAISGLVLVTTMFAVAVALAAFFVARSADQRALAADRRSLADKVVVHAEPLTDPSVSKVVLSWGLTVSNFGALPVEAASLRSTTRLPAPLDEEATYVAEIGVIKPCTEVFAEVDALGDDPRIVFTDVNGRTWSRRPEKQATAGSDDLEPSVNDPVNWESRRLDCGGLR